MLQALEDKHAIEPSKKTTCHKEDRELARKAASGDKQATETLVARLSTVSAMIRARHRRMGAPLREEELSDVIQNAFMAIWRKLASYEGRAALETWMHPFATNELYKATHKRFRDKKVDTEEEELIALAGAAPAKRQLPVETGFIYKSLDALDTAQGIVVRAHVLEQQTFPKIAKELSIPLGTAKTHYYRALGRLRGLITRRMAH